MICIFPQHIRKRSLDQAAHTRHSSEQFDGRFARLGLDPHAALLHEEAGAGGGAAERGGLAVPAQSAAPRQRGLARPPRRLGTLLVARDPLLNPRHVRAVVGPVVGPVVVAVVPQYSSPAASVCVLRRRANTGQRNASCHIVLAATFFVDPIL